MKKLACAVTVALGLVLAATVSSQAHDGDWRGFDRRFEERREFERHRRFEERRDFHRWGSSRVFIGVGPSISWGPAPAYVFGGYPAPAYGYAPPPPTYWYFCPSYGAYYPNVPSCPEPWVPVPTR
jgi:hypothetical protein